jgi:hypothetical protein
VLDSFFTPSQIHGSLIDGEKAGRYRSRSAGTNEISTKLRGDCGRERVKDRFERHWDFSVHFRSTSGTMKDKHDGPHVGVRLRSEIMNL